MSTEINKICTCVGVIVEINKACVKVEIPGIPVSMILLSTEINLKAKEVYVSVGDMIKIESFYEIDYEKFPYVRKCFIYTLEKEKEKENEQA